MISFVGSIFLSKVWGLISNNAFSRLIFLVQILIAEAMFTMRFPRKQHFVLRVIVGVACFIPVSLIVDSLVLMVLPPLAYLSISILSFLLVPLCFEIDFWNTLFCCASASVVQNVSYNIGAFTSAIFNVNPDITYGMVTAFIQVPVYIACNVVCFLLCSKKLNRNNEGSIERIPIILIVLLFIFIIFLAQYDRQLILTTDFYWWKILFISCDLLCLYLMFGMSERATLKAENALLEQLMQKESKQYELSKSTIELINIKCHDIKHQINALRTMPASDQQNNISELENSVMIYDSIAKTGNAALDVILTSKSLLCEQHKIRLAYICDGEKLNVLSIADIYSLFGNALDNAIEAVMVIENETKRVINLKVSKQGNFLSIHMENYCETELQFNNGLPVTTKENTYYHGFGLLSIRYIVEKHNGVMSTSLRNGMFCLDVIIPVE